MADFYQRMKINVADKLLTKFQQGSIALVRRTVSPPASPGGAPIVSNVSHQLQAIASGVSQQYVDGVTILATDLQVVSAVPDGVVPTAGDVITIDGKSTVLLRIVPVPAAGLTVAYKFLVRA